MPDTRTEEHRCAPVKRLILVDEVRGSRAATHKDVGTTPFHRVLTSMNETEDTRSNTHRSNGDRAACATADAYSALRYWRQCCSQGSALTVLLGSHRNVDKFETKC